MNLLMFDFDYTLTHYHTFTTTKNSVPSAISDDDWHFAKTVLMKPFVGRMFYVLSQCNGVGVAIVTHHTNKESVANLLAAAMTRDVPEAFAEHESALQWVKERIVIKCRDDAVVESSKNAMIQTAVLQLTEQRPKRIVLCEDSNHILKAFIEADKAELMADEHVGIHVPMLPDEMDRRLAEYQQKGVPWLRSQPAFKVFGQVRGGMLIPPAKNESVEFILDILQEYSGNVDYGFGVVVLRNDQCLLVQGKGGHWGFPKGHMEDSDGDDDQAAAFREVLEETGLTLTSDSLLCQHSFKERYGHFSSRAKKFVVKTVTYWAARYPADQTVSIQEQEIMAFRWCTLDEASSFLKPSRLSVLKQVLKSTVG